MLSQPGFREFGRDRLFFAMADRMTRYCSRRSKFTTGSRDWPRQHFVGDTHNMTHEGLRTVQLLLTLEIAEQTEAQAAASGQQRTWLPLGGSRYVCIACATGPSLREHRSQICALTLGCFRTPVTRGRPRISARPRTPGDGSSKRHANEPRAISSLAWRRFDTSGPEIFGAKAICRGRAETSRSTSEDRFGIE